MAGLEECVLAAEERTQASFNAIKRTFRALLDEIRFMLASQAEKQPGARSREKQPGARSATRILGLGSSATIARTPASQMPPPSPLATTFGTEPRHPQSVERNYATVPQETVVSHWKAQLFPLFRSRCLKLGVPV